MIDWGKKSNINKLNKLVERGLNAELIGNEFGTTKSAIIGKCRRLGLKLAGSPCLITRKHLPKKQKPKRLSKRLHLKTKEPPKIETTIKIKVRKRLKMKTILSEIDLKLGMDEMYKRIGIPPIPDNHICHYIYGDDIKNGNHSWCNQPVYKSSLYCKDHYIDVYQTNYVNQPQNYIAPRSKPIR